MEAQEKRMGGMEWLNLDDWADEVLARLDAEHEARLAKEKVQSLS